MKVDALMRLCTAEEESDRDRIRTEVRDLLKNQRKYCHIPDPEYLIRELLHLSLPEIGKEFGRDHTTVLHSCDKIQNLLKDPDSVLHNKIRDITANINNKV